MSHTPVTIDREVIRKADALLAFLFHRATAEEQFVSANAYKEVTSHFARILNESAPPRDPDEPLGRLS